MTDNVHIDRPVPAADEAAGTDEPEASEPLAEAERKRDEYLDRLQRLAAEFDNYKKRVAREQTQMRAAAAERLLGNLLPVLDDLERAVSAFDQHDKEHVQEGVALVHRALSTLLEKEGIIAIEPAGEAFDPHRHEALLSEPADAPEGTVLHVVQKGFLLGDRVLRPARVVIAAAKE